MTSVRVESFRPQARPARRLARALGAPFAPICVHRFPDGEIMPVSQAAADVVILYCSLDHPNEKLIALLLAADGLRRAGAKRIVLVAPYLCYMRQDAVFAEREPLSRDVICGLLGDTFDRVVTVDAHLHRTKNLSAAFGGIEADNLSAAGVLAEALAGPPNPIVVGPDTESEPWVRAAAERLGAEVLLFRKTRRGDADVALTAPDLVQAAGRPVFIVDDICSSGATLTAVAAAMRAAGAASIDVGVVHAIFGRPTEARLRQAGVGRIVSSDAVPHHTNRAPLAALLGAALRDEITP